MYLCMKFMKYGIIGTGAIGGFYGGKLAHAGMDVHFLLHKDYEYVCEHGLQVDSCDGSFHLDHVNAYRQTADMPVCDVVLVCLKSVNNHLLSELLSPLLDSHTVVVMIENGIGIEDDVQLMFPEVQLVAGLAFICSAKTKPGLVNHQCYGSINLANYSCRDADRMQQLVADFVAAGINTRQVEYHEARWKKAVWNMPFNGMTVALNTSTDQLLKNSFTRKLIHDLMMEVIGAARHLGVQNIDASFAEKMLMTTDAMVPYSPSMKLDYDYHRPLEIEYLYSRPIAEARKAGYSMPKLEMLEAELKFLASKNKRQGA